MARKKALGKCKRNNKFQRKQLWLVLQISLHNGRFGERSCWFFALAPQTSPKCQGYRSFRYKVVSTQVAAIQVYLVEVLIVPRTWLKEPRIFTQSVFLVHPQTILEVNEIFVQFNFLSSYRNDFVSKRPVPSANIDPFYVGCSTVNSVIYSVLYLSS